MGVRPHDFDSLYDFQRAKHKFCSVCGNPMATRVESAGFDVEDGAPLEQSVLTCSWKLADSTHDRVELEIRTVVRA